MSSGRTNADTLRHWPETAGLQYNTLYNIHLLVNILVRRLHLAEILVVDLHQTVNLLVIVLHKLAEDPLPLLTGARGGGEVPQQGRQDGHRPLLVLLRRHACSLAALRCLHEQREKSSKTQNVHELDTAVSPLLTSQRVGQDLHVKLQFAIL